MLATYLATPRLPASASAPVLILSLWVVCVASLGFLQPLHAEPLRVSAPPSLRPALTEILPMFEREYQASVQATYTPSRSVVREIEHGAPIDVFLTAGGNQLDQLHKKQLTLNGAPRIYARTSLVLVMSSESSASFQSFEEAMHNPSTRIVLADPKTSSLGDLTAHALHQRNPQYKNRANILYAPHSEEIIQLIRRGKAELGLVYRIDTINSGQVRISDETPLGSPIKVEFEQAVVSTCRTSLRKVAEQFSDFLMSARIQKLLIKYGFES